MAVEVPANFKAYVDALSQASGKNISNFNDYIDAIQSRHDFFASMGCKLSDHGIEEFYAEDYTEAEIKAIFDKVYAGNELNQEEILKFKSAMMYIFAVRQFFCMVYHDFAGSAANHTMIPCLAAAHSIERSNRQYYIYFLAFFGLCHFLTVYNHAGQCGLYAKLCVAHKFCSAQIAQLFFHGKCQIPCGNIFFRFF